MKQFLKYLIVSLFIFSVMERTGISAGDILIWKSIQQQEIGHDNEDAEESSENSKELFKEYWHPAAAYMLPLANPAKPGSIPENKNYTWSFYPSIPTPPPDALC